MQFSNLTKPELENIIEHANFTEEEEKIFILRTKGKTITEIAQKVNECNRTVYRRIRKIKAKINKIGGCGYDSNNDTEWQGNKSRRCSSPTRNIETDSRTGKLTEQ